MIFNQTKSIILPARIDSYDPATQLVDATVSVERVYSDIEQSAKSIERAKIFGAPVHTPSGGGWSLSFPIAVGDTCLIVFSQAGYDHWLYEDKDFGGTVSGVPKPHVQRHFSDDDGFVMVGFNTLPRALTGLTSTDSTWANADNTQEIKLLANGDIDITASAKLSIACPEVTIVGKLVVDGDIEADNVTATVEVKAGAVGLTTHTHTLSTVVNTAVTTDPITGVGTGVGTGTGVSGVGAG